MEIGLYDSAIAVRGEQLPTNSASLLAKDAEARGFDALFIGEHSHTPVDTVPTATYVKEPLDNSIQILWIPAELEVECG
jgi:alkanesulfonate monooxygenase SsuD/methylene tetrahydromethanopterin reductase-like flavin-dependent oxidoreductase (luciferase family)